MNSSAAMDPAPSRRDAAVVAGRVRIAAGLLCWCAIVVVLLMAPHGFTFPWWDVLGGLLVGVLLAGGNAFLLRGLLLHQGLGLLRSRPTWGVLWASKLAVLGALLYFSLTRLGVSPVFVALGTTMVLPALLLQLAGPVPGESEVSTPIGGEHGRV